MLNDIVKAANAQIPKSMRAPERGFFACGPDRAGFSLTGDEAEALLLIHPSLLRRFADADLAGHLAVAISISATEHARREVETETGRSPDIG